MSEQIRIPGQANKENKLTVLEILRSGQHTVPAHCNGSGRCGKCKIRLLMGTLPVTDADCCFLTKEEQKEGIRLACRAIPEQEILIELPEQEAYRILTDQGENDVNCSAPRMNDTNYSVSRVNDTNYLVSSENDTYCSDEEDKSGSLSGGISFTVESRDNRSKMLNAVIDLGTTTVVLVLYRADGTRIGETAFLNPQRSYGADVISRIQASNEGQRETLQSLICEEIGRRLAALLQSTGNSADELKRVVLAGNTAMIHLLLGYSCEQLGIYPFRPVTLDLLNVPAAELFGTAAGSSRLTIFPGISAFVGGDIVAGMYANGFLNGSLDDGIRLLVDLGTNGEMAVWQGKKLFVASAAAGPAFEGGNISCGTGSVTGALEDITISGGRITERKTIFNGVPCGICGSGVVALTAELLDAGICDCSGKLCEEYFQSGFPFAEATDGHRLCLTQKDIRELQMAKSAIRAGIELLLKRAAAKIEDGEPDISSRRIRFYISGGFGKGINLSKAIRIGMLPKLHSGEIIPVGNSCLAGLEKYLFSTDGDSCLQKITDTAEEISLATEKDFFELYMDYMSFP